MRIDTWLEMAKQQVSTLDAELIALEVFAPRNADRSWLVTHDEECLLEREVRRAQKLLSRRAKGEPLAYVLGAREFYGRRFVVNKDVLIPRPETESLIDLTKSLDLPRRARFIEVGTGSGCIAVTLALEFPQSEVLATDAYFKALDVAAENDLLLEGRIHLLHSNLLRDLRLPAGERDFDVLVANLPYVDPTWDWLDNEGLAFEPKTALFAANEHGLSFYKRLLRELRLGDVARVQYVIFEADPCQHEELVALADKNGYRLMRTEGYGLLFERGVR